MPLSREDRAGEDDTKKSQQAKKKGTSHVPCKFYKQGACQLGENCPFSHEIVTSATKPVCKFFLANECKFGHKCALAHVYKGQPMSYDRKNKRAQQLRDRELAREAEAEQQGQNGSHAQQAQRDDEAAKLKSQSTLKYTSNEFHPRPRASTDADRHSASLGARYAAEFGDDFGLMNESPIISSSYGSTSSSGPLAGEWPAQPTSVSRSMQDTFLQDFSYWNRNTPARSSALSIPTSFSSGKWPSPHDTSPASSLVPPQTPASFSTTALDRVISELNQDDLLSKSASSKFDSVPLQRQRNLSISRIDSGPKSLSPVASSLSVSLGKADALHHQNTNGVDPSAGLSRSTPINVPSRSSLMPEILRSAETPKSELSDKDEVLLSTPEACLPDSLTDLLTDDEFTTRIERRRHQRSPSQESDSGPEPLPPSMFDSQATLRSAAMSSADEPKPTLKQSLVSAHGVIDKGLYGDSAAKFNDIVRSYDSIHSSRFADFFRTEVRSND